MRRIAVITTLHEVAREEPISSRYFMQELERNIEKMEKRVVSIVTQRAKDALKRLNNTSFSGFLPGNIYFLLPLLELLGDVKAGLIILDIKAMNREHLLLQTQRYPSLLTSLEAYRDLAEEFRVPFVELYSLGWRRKVARISKEMKRAGLDLYTGIRMVKQGRLNGQLRESLLSALSDKMVFEKRIISELERNSIDVLLSDRAMFYLGLIIDDVSPIKGNVINSHPALLKGEFALPGNTPTSDAVRLKLPVVGATVHHLTYEVDSGEPIVELKRNVEHVMNSNVAEKDKEVWIRTGNYAGFEAYAQYLAFAGFEFEKVAWNRVEEENPLDVYSRVIPPGR